MSLLDSPLNTSPSKQKYSFPKNDRFKEKYESKYSTLLNFFRNKKKYKLVAPKHFTYCLRLEVISVPL